MSSKNTKLCIATFSYDGDNNKFKTILTDGTPGPDIPLDDMLYNFSEFDSTLRYVCYFVLDELNNRLPEFTQTIANYEDSTDELKNMIKNITKVVDNND